MACKKLVEAAHKPGSVPAAGYPLAGDDHSSGTAVTDGLKQPTRKHGRAILDASLFGLAPGGVYLASDVTAEPGELLPHPFTLTRLSGRTSLCGTIPGVAPAGRYPAPCPVEPGLSSPRTRRAAICSASTKPLFNKPASSVLTEHQHPLAVRTEDQIVPFVERVVKLGWQVHVAARAVTAPGSHESHALSAKAQGFVPLEQ
ncbi:hypothetical protein YM18_2970 [Geobacter sulfurreducens]|nr:hypothetical protein YM18_2970 [Geobacter sulfurreducens]